MRLSTRAIARNVSRGLNLEDVLFDGQERGIEGSSTEIEENVLLAGGLLVEIVGKGKLIDEHVELTSNVERLREELIRHDT